MLGKSNVIAIIPARKNSLGLPGKNTMEINGKPLFCWSVDAALKSNYVDRVIVSSNDEKVQSIVSDTYTSNKVIFKQRPENISDSQSSTEDAMRHAILDEDMRDDDIIVLLQPTSPARTNNLVDRVLGIMNDQNFDSCLTTCAITPFFWRLCDSGAYSLYDNLNRKPRQNISPNDYFYHDNGNVYCVRYKTFLKSGRFGGRVGIYPISRYESLQIDSKEDFLEMKYLSELYGDFI